MRKRNPFMQLFMQLGKAIQLSGTKRKQITASILTVCMVFTMLPLGFVTVSAATMATETADFFTNTTRALELLGLGASWDGSNSTLTLDNVSFETSAAHGILLPSNSAIILRGTNTINTTSGTTVICAVDGSGNYSMGENLTFKGDGALTINTLATYGIFVRRILKFSDNVTVTVNAQTGNAYAVLSNTGTAYVTDYAKIYAHSTNIGFNKFRVTSGNATVVASGATKAISEYWSGDAYKPSAWGSPNIDGSEATFISDISALNYEQLNAYKYIRIDAVEEVFVSNISAPTAITSGSKLTLTTPAITGTPTTQGWQISANDSTGWTSFDPAERTFTTSENEYYIRYYATNAAGTTYSNTVQITVNKFITALSLSAAPTSTEYPGNVELTATLTGADNVTGKTINFYNGADLLGSSTTGADGKAIYTVISPIVAVHSYKVVFVGDTNNSNAFSSINFTVSKGTQSTPVSFANTSDILKTYGDAVFALPTVSGGSGTGAYSYRSSNSAVVTVSGNTATIKDVGEAIIYVKRLGDANYNDSNETSVKVKVSPKSVIISGISANNKTYDGNLTASINATNAVINGAVSGDAVSIDYTNATASFTDKNAANNKTVNISGLTLGGTSANNYVLSATGQQTTTTAKITPATIIVTPTGGQFKYYGQSDPVLSFLATGAIQGETPAYSGTLSRAPGENIADHYVFAKGTLALSNNGTFLASNYQLVLDTAPVLFEIMEYTTSAVGTATPNGQNGWFNTAPVTLSAPAGYLISTSNVLSDDTWTNSITLDHTDGINKSTNYYLRSNSGTNEDAISSIKAFNYFVDKTNPGDPTVTLNGNAPEIGWYTAFPTIEITAPTYVAATAPETTYYKLWNTSAAIDNIEPASGNVFVAQPAIAKDGIWKLKIWTEDAAGNTSTPATITIKVDTTAPDGDIRIKENSAKTFINKVTFGLFFNQNVDVRMTAADETSGIAKIEYNKSTTILDPQDVKNLVSWSEYTGVINETAVDSSTSIYYIKITDNSDNVTYIASNGVTFDTTMPVISGITNGTVYYVDQSVTVTDKNLDTITLNGSPFASGSKLTGDADAANTVDATDKAGNRSMMMVTMKPIASLSTDIDSLSIDHVKSSDKMSIEGVAANVEAVLLTTNNGASQAQMDKLNAILDKCNDLLAKTHDIKDKIAAVNVKTNIITTDNVKSSDKTNLESALSIINELLATTNLTEGEKLTLEKKKTDIANALERITEVQNTVLNVYDPVKNITTENVSKTDRSALEQAVGDLQNIFDKDANNLTDAEIKEIKERINSIKTILNTLDQSIDALKKARLLDEPTGTSIEGVNGTVFDLRTELVVTSVSKTLDADSMQKFSLRVSGIASGQQIAQLYDIKLLLDGQTIQPDGMVKITLTLTDEQANYTNLQIVYIADDGTTTIIPSKINGKEISFITDHFSYYAIIGTPIPETGTVPDTDVESNLNQIPKTGESTPFFPYIEMSFLSAVLLLAVKLKRKFGAVEL